MKGNTYFRTGIRVTLLSIVSVIVIFSMNFILIGLGFESFVSMAQQVEDYFLRGIIIETNTIIIGVISILITISIIIFIKGYFAEKIWNWD